jgi:sugar lactone lactonase YvrE
MGAVHPALALRLAGGNARLGKRNECAAWLELLAEAGQSIDPAEVPDLASVVDAPEIKPVLERFRRNLLPTNNSSLAFTLSEKNLIPEGVVFDSTEKQFLIGSINLRKIVSTGGDGKVKDVATQKDGLWSVFGLCIDAKRKQLWAASSALKGMNGLADADRGTAGLFVFDMKKMRLAKKVLLPAGDQEHVLGDVIVNSKGDAFTTDSITPALYLASHNMDRLQKLLGAETFRSPQGLCFSPDERWMFVADYVRGVFVIDMEKFTATKLTSPDNQASLNTVGIDGLYFYNDSLIATQNGVRPNRILRILLGSNAEKQPYHSIVKVAVLESNHELFGEPTLGTIVGDEFYYVGNSQLGAILEDPKTEIRPAVILKLLLK